MASPTPETATRRERDAWEELGAEPEAIGGLRITRRALELVRSAVRHVQVDLVVSGRRGDADACPGLATDDALFRLAPSRAALVTWLVTRLSR